jgi:hypothetical protein
VPVPFSFAQLLSTLWQRHKQMQFVDYLLDTCGCKASSPLNFQCIYIAELDSGDFDKGFVGGLVQHWWKIDDSGLRSISAPSFSSNNDSEQDLFVTPLILFFQEGGLILISEKWGPLICCMKRGKLREGSGQLMIEDITVLWNIAEH